MAVRKARNLQVSIPIQICYDQLLKIGNNLEWKLLGQDKRRSTLKWNTSKSRYRVGVHVTATLRKSGERQTRMNLIGEIPGLALVDGGGKIPKAFENLIVPLETLATNVNKQIREGVMCPTCGKELPPGTRFCPKDGTTIASECPQCGNSNVPAAQFCSSCGTSLSP